MQLSVRERLIILSIIPQEGDFVTLKVLRNLQENLSFNEEEHKRYKFVEAEGKITWDNSAEQNKDFELGEKATDIVANALRKLSEQKKLRMEHFDIYQKFVKE